ncbi:MAG: hypothetical protein EOP83_29160 [Verrucomicrobiaceae bacterium]|nr:MAG: hypothetical protein EOP83_29160 [Verrucomicrobiaceae bacterium]
MTNLKVWQGDSYPLGATLTEEGVNFALFSENATDWPGLRTWSSISRRLRMFFWWMPSGETHGEEVSPSEFAGTTGADSVSGVNQISVPAIAAWLPRRAAVSARRLRKEECFIGMIAAI